MATSPFPTNTTAATVDKAIDGVFVVSTTIGKTALFSAVWWLNVPVIRTLVGWLIDRVSQLIYKNFAMFVTFRIIEAQVSGQVSDSQKTLAALKAAQEKGDLNAIEQALVDFQAATAKLTHLDGSASP